MKIKNVEWVNNTGIEYLANPVIPYNDKTDAMNYTTMLMGNIGMYDPQTIKTKVDIVVEDGEMDIKIEMTKK